MAILSRAMSVLVQAASLFRDKSLPDLLKVALSKSRHIISFICHAENASSISLDAADHRFSETWESFPIPGNWQTPFHEKISLKAHNLCVACCVSSFSGWEPNEFNLDLLRSRDNGNLFAVSLSGPFIAGFLSDNVASAISEQWQYMQNILPNLEILRFDMRLSERTNSEWYQKVMRNMKKQSSDFCKISSYGEADAIMSLLSFSMLCLIAALHSEGVEKDEFVKLSMSVLLPTVRRLKNYFVTTLKNSTSSSKLTASLLPTSSFC